MKDILVAKMYGISKEDWPKRKCLLDSITTFEDPPIKEQMQSIRAKLRLSMFSDPNLDIGADIKVKSTHIQDVHQFIGYQTNGERYMLYKKCYKHIAKMDLTKLKKLPLVGEKVLVEYATEICRGIVVNRMDPATVKIYFIDHGLCQKAKNYCLFKYDQMLNEYPPFAIRFRINGIQPCKPNDIYVIQGMQKLLLPQRLSAEVVGINRINENEVEIEANFWDVNGSNIAMTLIEKRLARIR